MQCSDVVVYLDNLLYKTAHKIWKKQADKEQSVAMLKALFCELKVPQKWGIKVLFPEFEDSEFTRLMQNSFFESVPPCVFSEMPTQAIESYKFPLASKLKATLVKQES